jgi:outer membrane protein assembly factor BamB
MRRSVLLFALGAVLLFSAVGRAQEEEDEVNAQVWINEYTEGADMLSFAEREVAKENYKAAIEVYQGLIDKVRKEKDFATKVVHSGENVYLPLRKRCYDEIMKLPAKGREVYGILYEAKAERMYEEAFAKQDVNGLLEVAQDYLLTRGGRKACLALADLSIEGADYSLALHYLDTLAEYHCGDSGEPALCSLKRAACLIQSGEKYTARKIMEALQKASLSEDECRVCACLQELIKDAPAQSKDVYNSYYDGFLDIEAPPSIKLLEKPAPGQPENFGWQAFLGGRQVADGSGQRFGRGNYGALARGTSSYDIYPVYYNDTVFVNNSNRIWAFSAGSGKIKWRHPDTELPGIRGLPLGCYISDGRLFAVLRDTGSAPVASPYGGAPQAAGAVNDLYCYKAVKDPGSSTNKPVWQTAPMRKLTALGQISFTSIPYVDGSRVYVAGVEVTEQDKNQCVCCLSTSGNVLWVAKFCATKYPSGYGQAALLEAASLVVSRGKVIVCTNGGVAASFSAFTGDLEWIYRYPLAPAAKGPGARPQLGGVTWEPLPPVVWYGIHPADKKPCHALVLAPGDSEFVFGFDMSARRLLWRWERTRHTYLIGPRGEDVFVCGGTSLESSSYVVRQHRIPDGLIKWEAPLGEANRPVAKGVATPDRLIIPCEWKILEVISGKDEKAYFGKVAGEAVWYGFDPGREKAGQPGPGEKEVLRGNLLLTPYMIFVAGYEYLNCFKKPQEKEKEKEK